MCFLLLFRFFLMRIDLLGVFVFFQVYFDNIEIKIGFMLCQFIDFVVEKGFDSIIKVVFIVVWFKEDYQFGQGYVMVFVYVIIKGLQISDKYVGSGGMYVDVLNILWFDGKDINFDC